MRFDIFCRICALILSKNGEQLMQVLFFAFICMNCNSMQLTLYLFYVHLLRPAVEVPLNRGCFVHLH